MATTTIIIIIIIIIIINNSLDLHKKQHPSSPMDQVSVYRIADNEDRRGSRLTAREALTVVAVTEGENTPQTQHPSRPSLARGQKSSTFKQKRTPN